jgi:hypothetical protein
MKSNPIEEATKKHDSKKHDSKKADEKADTSKESTKSSNSQKPKPVYERLHDQKKRPLEPPRQKR